MSKETKFIEVDPSEVETTLEKLRSFGWELMGTPQGIYDKSSHLEKHGDETYSITKTTYYVKITVQREKSIPNYAELVDLEQKFFNISNVSAHPKKIGTYIRRLPGKTAP